MGCGAAKLTNAEDGVQAAALTSNLQGSLLAPAKYSQELVEAPAPDASEELLSVGRPGTPEGRVAEEPSPIMLRIRMAYTIFMAEMADKQHTAEEMQMEALDASLSGSERSVWYRSSRRSRKARSPRLAAFGPPISAAAGSGSSGRPTSSL